MSGMIRQEADFLLVSLLWGVGLTAVYDCLRIIRVAVRHASFAIAAEDFLYWVFAAFSLFILLFSMNDGNLRWYALAGAGAGMWLYHITLSRFLVKWLGALLSLVMKGLAFPMKILGGLLKKRVKWLTIKLKKKKQDMKQSRAPGKKSREESGGRKQRKEKIPKTKQNSRHGNSSGDSSLLRNSFLQDKDTAGQGQPVRRKRKQTGRPD